MDSNNILGEILEKGQSVGQKTGKAVTDSAAGAVKTAAGQITGDSSQPGMNETNAVSDKAQNEEFVKELYAPSKPQDGQNPEANQKAQAEEQAKLAGVRQKLHDEVYYQPLIQGTKSQEERPAEKVERERKEEMQDLQKKENKKPGPVAVQRAQQSAEKFRGASG
jgi:hypothetical protein